MDHTFFGILPSSPCLLESSARPHTSRQTYAAPHSSFGALTPVSGSLTATNTGSLVPRCARSSPHGTLIVSVAVFTLPSPRRVGRSLPTPASPGRPHSIGACPCRDSLREGRDHRGLAWALGSGRSQGPWEEGPESQAAARSSQPISPPHTRLPGSYTTRWLSLGGEAAWSLPTNCI